jgi:GTP cyclohydrolase I
MDAVAHGLRVCTICRFTGLAQACNARKEFRAREETGMPDTNTKRTSLIDVQAQANFCGRPIQKVGVTNIRHPLSFSSSGKVQSSVGIWQLLVSLAGDKRGTHMSRFMEILSGIGDSLTIQSLVETCEEVRLRLLADDTFLVVDFPWFVEKTAPVSKARGKIDFDVRIEISRGTSNDCTVTVRVPATSLCPCSKSISDFGAHNQRCELTVAVRFAEGEAVSLEELFRIAENSASAQLYSVIKREDEKQVTEEAYKNPKFVEDTVRDLAEALHDDARIRWYRCASENFESIHNHDAYAQIECDKAAI